jgi:hypothetical protein
VAAAEEVIMSDRSPAKRTKGDGALGEGSFQRATGSKDIDAPLLSKPALARKIGVGLTVEFVLESMAGKDVSGKALRQQVEHWRQDLLQPGDGPLEELVVERVIASFLAAANAEELRTTCLIGGHSNESTEFWDRHLSRTNADFLRAAKTLATIRRLRLPVVRQLNIGQQQVNVAAETVGGDTGES